MSLVDQPAAVAAAVEAESGWVPGWQRVGTAAVMVASPLLAAAGHLAVPAVASVATAAALCSRVVPLLAARRLRHDGRRATIRRARERCLTAYAVCGLVPLASLPLLAASRWGLAVGLLAVGLVVLQHRPALADPWVALAAEGAESLALLGILPLLAMATRVWWS